MRALWGNYKATHIQRNIQTAIDKGINGRWQNLRNRGNDMYFEAVNDHDGGFNFDNDNDYGDYGSEF